DARFTRMALDIFAEFGFHMILATPLKMLQVLEDYVGGIALITSPDGMKSYASEVSIEDQRLSAAGGASAPAREQEAAESQSATQNGIAETDQHSLFGDGP